jgi:hypothetical protein
MILRLLKGRGLVLGIFEKKRDDILPHPTPPQTLLLWQKLYSHTHHHSQQKMLHLETDTLEWTRQDAMSLHF